MALCESCHLRSFLFVVLFAMYRSFHFSGKVPNVFGPRRVCGSSLNIRCLATGSGDATLKNNVGKSAKTHNVASDAAKGAPQGIDELRKVRVAKMDAFKAKGINPYAYTFDQTHKAAELQVSYADIPNGEEREDVEVSVSGRIMLRRVFGKLAFFQLQDDTGSIQLYLDKARLPGDSFEDIKTLTDAGDIIGVKGTLKRTDKVGVAIFLNCVHRIR